jgi:hypothetical protein
MYSREQIQKYIPGSEDTLKELHEKYKDIKWIQYLYIDGDYEDVYVAISNKGDILYNTYYIGIRIPEKAICIERREEHDEIELEDYELYIFSINKNITSIIKEVDRILRRKIKNIT